jgi:hypothetical protein
MWVVWLVVCSVVLLAVGVLLNFAPAFRVASTGWRLLSLSGIPLALTGVNFILRFWHPTAGPYRANELYPYGSHLQTWAVSFGFAWLAFGMLFAALALVGARDSSRSVWIALLASWFICWLPHGIIGVGFAWAGRNAPSVRAYQDWASQPAGFALLFFNALTLLAHFGLSLMGFVLTGIELRRKRGVGASPGN